MSVQFVDSELLVDLSTDEQELLSGGRDSDRDKDKDKDDFDGLFDRDKEKDFRKVPIAIKGILFLPTSSSS